VQLYIKAAQASIKLGRNDALDYLRKAQAIERHPHSGVVIQSYEELYTELGLIEDREELRAWELAELPPCRLSHDFARRSARMIEVGRFEDALNYAKAGLLNDDENVHLLINAGIAASRIGQDDIAILYLAKLNPYDDREVYLTGSYLRALLLRKVGNLESALDVLQGILTWKPGQADALILRGHVFVELGRVADAETAFQEAMVHDVSRAALELAGLYLRQGRFDEAQAVADMALQQSGAPA
jgi:tetratricopeptide (TPR) repeat protein